MERKIKRGDIYYANLNPVIGSEQGGRRPVLIISNDVGNKHSPTVIVAPITSRINTKAKLPTHTLINNFEGLDKNSIILLEQVRTIDKQRLHRHLHALKEPYREVFMLRVFGDLSFKEIADICGKSESWAKVTFYRAKSKLVEDMEGKI